MRIGVIGAGGWGTALAALLVKAGHDVCMWARNPDVCATLQQHRENRRYLPGIVLPEQLTYTASLSSAVTEKELLVLAVPAQALRSVAEDLVGWLDSSDSARSSCWPLLVSTSKGVEEETLQTMSVVLTDVVGETIKKHFAVLSGPSFAADVVKGLPTAVTVAAFDLLVAQKVQQVFSTAQFRVYTTTDVVGVEIGGAVKNVIALAAGVSDGLGYSYSARAALITRGLVEMTRLASCLGAHPQTLSGLSGMGDLVLTCTSDLSRNYRVGLRLGQGERIQDVLAGMTTVAEGVHSCRSVFRLAQHRGVEMPIVEQVHALLYANKSPRHVVAALLAREVKPEFTRLELLKN